MFLLRRQPKQPPRQLNVWRTPTSSSAAGIRVDKKNLNVEHVGEDDSEFVRCKKFINPFTNTLSQAVISQHPFSLMKDSYFEVTIESLSKNGYTWKFKSKSSYYCQPWMQMCRGGSQRG